MITRKHGQNGAIFSDCEQYRYKLWRTWDNEKSPLIFIGLNPSTADETVDDATIIRCTNRAKLWGYGGLIMLNLFAYRATNPNDMKKAQNPIGDNNDDFLKEILSMDTLTIAAWGTHGRFKERDKQIKNLIPNLHCLDITKDGHPKHPLYIPMDKTPIPYS